MRNRIVTNRALRTSLILLLVFIATAVLFAVAMPSEPQLVQAAPLQQSTPVVSFTRTSDNVIEPDDDDETEITISVRINTAPEEEVRVSYATTNGSATAGVDYQATSGTLTFPAGSAAEQSFTVTIFGNNLDEGDRNFSVFLTNPVNATVGSPNSIQITIVDNDQAAPTSTRTPTPGGAVFIDDFEPNNSFDSAFTTAAEAPKLTNITLWPQGDEDYFRFFAKKGAFYEVFTIDLSPGLDTFLTVYEPNGNKIAENDDVGVADKRSRVTFTAKDEGFYFARVVNRSPIDPTNLTYSFEVNETVPPTPTPGPTRLPVDACEPNNTLGTACLIGPGETLSNMSFVPPEGEGPDTDFYVMPVKPGVLYTCQTTNLSPPNDTNIIFLDPNGGDFNPPLGNDDRALGDKSSLLSFYSTYQGNLNIVVGPVNPPSYANSPQYTYDISCTATAATPTSPPPPPTATFPPAAPPSGGGAPRPTAIPSPTSSPTPDLTGTATPTLPAPVIIDFVPLPTATPVAGAQVTTRVQVTVFYDANGNFMPELDEGIMDIAVALYDNATGALIAFGYTNEAGVVLFDSIVSSGPVRVDVAFLRYSLVVPGGSANILLRVEPRPLPGGIP